MANYARLASWLQKKGLTVVFVGKSEEKREKDQLAVLPDGIGIIDLTGRSTLPELFDIIQGAVIVISNDTGPAHAAIALGTKTVVVVGGGHFGCFVPYPDGVAPEHARFVFEHMDCYHCFWRCHKRTDSQASFPCVEAVSMEKVQMACLDLLALEKSH
tara:strand:- start:92 stop:565 length:474 start_codon:yes stop_codon:yes gene_type:complete